MLLTKGAIGNLINRYRAVLKKCHLMNVFGSIALIGMLVGGMVSPVCGTSLSGNEWSGSVTISGADTFSGSATAVADTLTIKNGGTLTISGGSNHAYVKGAITLQSGGTLTLSGDYGLIGTDGSSGESAVEFSGSAFDMNGGTLDISGSQIQTGAVTISDGIINISGRIGSGNNWNDGAMFGAVADGTTSSTPEQIAAATFTLADGTLTLGDYGQVFGGVVTLQGGKIRMQGSASSGASIVRAYGGDSGGMLTIKGTELSVEANKYGILAADNMVLESGAISVASGGHLAVVGNLNKGSGDSAAVLSGGYFNSSKLAIDGGTLTVEKGGVLAAPKLAVTQNSGSVTVNGTFNGDIASVGGNDSLSYSGSSYTLNGGTLTVSGDMQVGNLKITDGEATVAGATAPSNWDNGTMLGGYGVGNNNTTEITGGTITVGDYGVFFAGQDQPGSGSLSFTGGTLSLNGSSKAAAGILLVSNGSGSGNNWANTFDISDNAALKVDSGKFGVLIAGETNMNGGAFTVDGALTMAPSAKKGNGSSTIANAIASGGSHTVFGTTSGSGTFTQTGGDLKVTGSLLAEKINYTLSGSGKADLSAGNTVFKTVMIENEGLTVNKIKVVASGSAIEASGAAGTLTTSKLTVNNTGLVDITGNGSLQNVAASGSDQGVFVNDGGTFKADYADLFTASGGLATNVSQFSGANGGLVSIVNTDNAIKFADIGKYAATLFGSGSSGGISFSNITVESGDLIQSGAAAGTLDVQNMSPGTVVTNYDIGIQTTTSGASGTNATVDTKNNLIGGDALVVAQASGVSGGNAEVTVSGSGGLTLLQGTDNNGNLIEVRDASGAYVPGTTNVTVADNSALNIGMAGTSGKGTLNGDVTLGSGSALNITGTSGSEYMVGDVTGASGSTSISHGVIAETGDIDVKDVTVNSTAMANTGKITVEDLNVAGAKINASGDITVRQNAKLSDAAIVATATDTSSGNVSLSGNATLGNTTVEADGAVNLSADLQFAPTADKKLANSSFTAGNGLTIGQGLTTHTSGGTATTIAQENVTYTAQSGDVTVKGSEVMAGSSGGLGIIAQSGDINAGGASFSTKGGDLILAASGDIMALSIDGTSGNTVVQAKALNLTNGGGASLTLDTAESMAMVSTLAASGDVTLGKGATLSATGTGSGAASTIEGELTVSEGSRAGFGDVILKDDVLISDGSAVQVAGEATLASGADVLLSESSLTANALTTNGGTVAVGNDADATGSTLIIGTLKATNTVFIADPQVGDVTQGSFIHVNSVDMTTSGGNTLLAGNAGVVSLGSRDRTWVNAQIAASGLKPTAVFATDMKGIELDHYAVAAGDKYTTAASSPFYTDGYSGSTPNYQGFSAQKLALQSGSLTVIDRTNMAANDAVFTSTAGTGAFISEGASFRLVSDTGLKARENYVLATDLNEVSQEHTASVDGALAFTDAAQQLSTDNRMVSLDGLNYDRTNGVLTMRTGLISASSVLPKLDGDLAALLDDIAVHKGFDERSSNAGIRFLSRALNPDRLGKDEAAATIEGAARMSAVAAVPQMTMNVADAASTAALSRTTFGSPLQDGRQAVAMVKDENGQWQAESGLNAGGVQNNGAALWIMPMYRNMNGFGFKAGEFTTGYTGNFGGVALGADVTFADAFRAGLTFNIGGGYAQSNGDFNSTDNDFNFWGVGAYGGWSQNNVGLTADVNYTSTYNKLSQELPSAMDMGDLKADVEAWAISAGLRGEYKFQTSVMDLIPHVGVRYMSLNTRDYDIKSGGKVFKADSSQQNIWTFPVGVTLSKDVKNDNGWIFKPSLDLAVVPAAGDVKNRTTVKVPGVGASADMSTRIMDDVTFQGGLGLNLQKDNLSMGVNYTLQASEHTTDHGVFATFRYEF